tara:strand:- start:12309 stop:13712 length:1404 start_codon:yes stop_codon:yes gene_type:complete
VAQDPKHKALEINLDKSIYGAFAEIGAGQEVVRHFFRAGGAAGTIAKTMSAYDMKFSDDIYGKEPSGRYVCESRLVKMLEHEYSLMLERLDSRAADTRFFAFADTVAAKSYSGKGESHGWMGLRFQHDPKAAASEVIIHVKMLDIENVQQQEALGVIGVNLVYAAYKHSEDRERFVTELMDGLTTERLEIDMIRVSGPAFSKIDSRLLSLELVKRNYCQAVMFAADGKVLQASDALYKKNIILCRGSYRPPTLVNLDMLERGQACFQKLLGSDKGEILVLPEISMNNLRDRGEVDNEDFLARVDLLTVLGRPVLITNYQDFGDLNDFISTYNRAQVAFVMGYYSVSELFDETKYLNVKDGILGSLGRLTGHNTRILVYPSKEDDGEGVNTVDSLKKNAATDTLVEYLRKTGKLHDITDYSKQHFSIWSRVVLKMIQEGQPGWESMVPPSVAKRVKEKCLFGYPCETN